MSLVAALTACVLAAAVPSSGRTVEVRVLERLHPSELDVSGPACHRLSAQGPALLVDGGPVPQPLQLPEGAWRLALPGAPVRHYLGALRVRSVEGVLAVVLALPLEAYVAEVVASETVPGTPEEALRAQAVVVRSFVLARGPRHADADVCDLAHCQVLRGTAMAVGHRARAAAATEATRGQVLALGSGAVAEAPFHAACGGHTADPAEVFGSDATGAAAVPDSGCPPSAWEARVPLAVFRRALAAVLQPAGESGEVEPGGLQLVPGHGGFTVTVLATDSGRAASGDAVARALDRAMGWGRVRSGRFRFGLEGDAVRVKGTGIGHGLGLCQQGAARRAARGDSYQAILRHYFPLAALR
jgi:stage II sporulation protein D